MGGVAPRPAGSPQDICADKEGDGAEVQRDAFLGGRVLAWQPVRGYRAGVDAVMLAAACPAGARDDVLELGCGAGVAALCLAERAGARVTGVELQPQYAALARRNGVDVVEADLTALPRAARRVFDHVICNPPYFDRQAGSAAPDSGREIAMGVGTPVASWVEVAARRLRPGGWLTLIQRVEQLPAVLAACEGRFGSVTVLPLAGREGRAPRRVIVWMRKGGRAPFHLAAPLVLHEGAAHGGDGADYRPEIEAILRDGAPLVKPQ